MADLEEKYKKSMMTAAQLDNEKSTLVYEVDCLKDVLADQEEHMMELSREARDKHRVCITLSCTLYSLYKKK